MHQTDASILRAVYAKHYRSISHRLLLRCLAGQLNSGMNTSGWFFQVLQCIEWVCLRYSGDSPGGSTGGDPFGDRCCRIATLASELREFRWTAYYDYSRDWVFVKVTCR